MLHWSKYESRFVNMLKKKMICEYAEKRWILNAYVLEIMCQSFYSAVHSILS